MREIQNDDLLVVRGAAGKRGQQAGHSGGERNKWEEKRKEKKKTGDKTIESNETTNKIQKIRKTTHLTILPTSNFTSKI